MLRVQTASGFEAAWDGEKWTSPVADLAAFLNEDAETVRREQQNGRYIPSVGMEVVIRRDLQVLEEEPQDKPGLIY